MLRAPKGNPANPKVRGIFIHLPLLNHLLDLTECIGGVTQEAKKEGI